MATPAFIYSFDNLGPDKFKEIVNLLLASRFKGYFSGGEGADGGIDGQIDTNFGFWFPENESLLLDEMIPPNNKVIFQFKHKTTARIGQAQSRQQLLNLYKSDKNNELDRSLLLNNSIFAYVLVTNVEINPIFIESYKNYCSEHNSSIKHFHAIGLDDLETWITLDKQLRHLYFPTIFGLPQYDLKININLGTVVPYNNISKDNYIEVFSVDILNIGLVPSYINNIRFRTVNNGKSKYHLFIQKPNPIGIYSFNPKYDTILEPGRKHSFNFEKSIFKEELQEGDIPVEIIVADEIGNTYIKEIDFSIRKELR